MSSNASVIVPAEFPVGADVVSSAMTAVTMADGEIGGMDTGRSTHLAAIRDLRALATNAAAASRS